MKLQSLADLEKLLPESERGEKTEKNEPKKREHDGKGKTVRVLLDTKDRKGKSVTVVTGLQHNPQTIEEIAKMLKQYCGAGGTVKDGNIEIQGDQRLRVTEKLKSLHYSVK
ncbi:MAG: translation initiation factor [Ignavibacteriales bacterium]|nr:translation initiation factor [Ignavibacteriales bacterium]